MKYNLKDVKYMHYLDYKLNNTPEGMKRYSGRRYPRLVEFLADQAEASQHLSKKRFLAEEKRLFKVLWREGLFRSCQA